MRPSFLPVLVPLALVACKAPDAAPSDIDSLAHFFLAQAEIQDHPRIVEGGQNLVAWFDASGLDGSPTGGTLTDLTRDELDAVPDLAWDPDPEPCAGIYSTRRPGVSARQWRTR